MLRSLLAASVLTILAVPLPAEVVFRYDFEQGTDLAAYEGLQFRDCTAEIVPAGPDGDGHCLKLTSKKASRYCTVTIRRPVKLLRNLMLSFDHREEIEEGKRAAYLGLLFFDPADKQWFGSDKFGPEWKTAEVQVARLNSPNGGVLTLGKELSHLNLYGRAEGDTEAVMTVWLDNIRLETREFAGRRSEASRVSTANPPLFNWSRTDRPSRLEYSRDPEFPEQETTKATTPLNFHTPDAPLEPGDWYWRVWSEDDLTSGYTETARIEITPEAHQFTTAPVPVDEIMARKRPWVVPVREVMDAERAQLVRQAENLHRQGVPDDPPPYAPGNPDWPTWIDWYGKVHGGITSGTGRRLQQIAEICAITGDPRVIEMTREMALKAAAWDPEGGSAMSRGDIGAHHLLRGLVWCYDALHDSLSEAERDTLRDIIVTRSEQFASRLNPFPGGGREFNNHAWLNAFGLGEAGLALLGEHPAADEWAEYVRQLFIGRFLCALGYQGDNNEGISYWGYGLWFVIDYSDMMKRICGINLFEHPWLAQTARFPMYCAPPGAWAVSFADTGIPNHGVRGPAQQTHVRNLALRTRDPYALWYSGAPGPVDDLAPKPPVDLPQSIHYKFIGWTIHNTTLVDGRDGVTLALRSGPFYAGHQHEDLNSFVLHAYGEKLAIDGGHYDWYGSPHFEGFSTLTRAHNAILVNGEDQGSRKLGADGKITGYFDSTVCGYTEGTVADPDVYAGKVERWVRRALFIKPGYVVIQDQIDATEGPARFDWLLHSVAGIATDAGSQSFALESGRASLRGRFIQPEGLQLEVKKGYPVEPVDGYSTRPLPPERYVDEWTLTATPGEQRKSESFLAAMQVRRNEPGVRDAILEPLEVTGGQGVLMREGDEGHAAAFRGRGEIGELAVSGLGTDGNVLCASFGADGTLTRAAAMACTVLRHDGKVLAKISARCAGISLLKTPEGHLCEVSLSEPASLELHTGQAERILVDGNAAHATSELLRADLAAGDHTIAWGDAPESVLSRPIGALVVGESPLEGYAQRRADGVAYYWWGPFSVAKDDRYALSFSPADEDARLSVVCDGRPLELTTRDGGASAELWLGSGPHFLTVSAREPIQSLSVDPRGLGIADATMLPAEYRPKEGSLIIEAETPVAEGAVKGKIMEKIGASGGLSHAVWDTDGQWAEWEFEVPQEGRYRILIRGAGEHDRVIRLLELDGKPLVSGGGVVRMKSTGGWCRTTDDWRYFLVNGPDGQPASVTLAPGKHRIRLERLGNSMNLDLFAWEPVGE